MAFDYKKEYKEYYSPPRKPELIFIPEMRFLAVRGTGNPNAPEGAYQQAIAQLYAAAYTLRMSQKAGKNIEGFFEYVVPPLEGLWQQNGMQGTMLDDSRKDDLKWISMIRLPDFISEADVQWAIAEAGRKKKISCENVEFFTYDEGLCVQALHIGSYDSEPDTVARMLEYLTEQECEANHTNRRLHHEIYLSDPRRTAPEKCKTVIRIPAKRIGLQEHI